MKKTVVMCFIVVCTAVAFSGCGKKDAPENKKVINAAAAVDFIRQSAEQGDVHSQYDLGVCYANGTGVEKNQFKAFQWWYKAAGQNYVQAQYEIGNCYEKGFGTVPFPAMAVYWYKMAAYQGYANAQYQLGKCCAEGIGVAKSSYNALYWYTLAALQGHEHSMAEVGIVFANGKTYSAEDTYCEIKTVSANREIAICFLEKTYRHNQQAAEAWRQLFKMDEKDITSLK